MTKFVKAHACGNDFLVVEGAGNPLLAQRLCMRTTGVGADGVEFLEWTGEHAGRIRLYNADGSVAEISGNGTRCVAAWMAHTRGAGPGAVLTLETDAGLRACRIVHAEGARFEIASGMGVPEVAAKIVVLDEEAIAIEGAVVSTGNPHFVIFVEDESFRVQRRSWQEIGRAICVHPDFPAQTNVEFVRVMATDTIAIRIFERGVGPTSSSGTGTCASAAAAMTLRSAARSLTVRRSRRRAARGLARGRCRDAADRAGGNYRRGRGVRLTSSKRPLKPPALKPGAHLRLVAPASSARSERLAAGADALRARGYRVSFGEHAQGKHAPYFSGTTAERLADLHAGFADPDVDSIICTRGGYGSNYLLQGLDLDLIRAHPKVFCGYSDMTALQTWMMDQTGLVIFHGPLAAGDFYLEDGVDDASFAAAVGGETIEYAAPDGLHVLRPGRARGVLYGGCLSLLSDSLGTPYAPQTEGKLLFLEDVGAKPYQVDRMLRQLLLAGKLDGVRGFIFGEMLDCASPGAAADLIETVILKVLDWFEGPIAIGLRSGHVSRANLTLPMNIEAELGPGETLAHPYNLEESKGGKHIHHRHLRQRHGVAWRAAQLKGHRVTGPDHRPCRTCCGRSISLSASRSRPSISRPRPDLVIVGNALSRGNVELEYVLDQRLPFTSLAHVIHEEFLAGRESLVVSGTHGKTTTTSLLAWIYEVAQQAPSFLIGGVAENFGTSFQLRETQPFIIEGDEYDTAFFDKGPKFMHYFPDALILTHVEFDHADIYRDLDAVKTAFKRLVNLVPQRGRIVAFDGSDNVTECIAHAMCAVERYGFSGTSAWRVTDLEHRDGRTHWTVLREGQPWGEFTLALAGEHNALNATAAAALAAGQGIGVEAIAEALATFESVKRRLEVRAVVDGITIIDDFAHHPTAIRETLRALRASYPGARLWAVLEPRSNTLRRNIFERELVESLALADRIVLAGVFKQESIPVDERLHPEAVIVALAAQGHEAALYANADAIVDGIAAELNPGDVVAILSNGGFDGIYDKLPRRLTELRTC